MFEHSGRWFPGWSVRRQDKAGRKNRTRPRLETLEDRLAPAVFNVNSTLDILAPPGPLVTLRSAIEAANLTAGSNTINLTVPGTYKITIPGAGEDNNATGDFDIIPRPFGTANSSLLIQNTSGGTVIIDGNQLDRVFDINPGVSTTKSSVTMVGFTIENGTVTDTTNADGPNATGGGIRDQGNADLTLFNMVIVNNNTTADGGGIVMENTVNSTWVLTINNSIISHNHAGDAGGGIDTDGAGTVIINNSVISNNTDVNQGAGIYVDAIQVGTAFVGAPMTMTGTLVSNNEALAAGTLGPPASGGSGGGISNAGNQTMTIVDSTIANNFAAGVGGGFSDENAQGSLVVTNSVFVNNSAAGDGGGIQEGGPSTIITTSLIQDNSSGGSGGGLFVNGTTLTVSRSTIVGNTATVGGGGIEVQTTGTGAGASTITNATITANQAANNAGANGGGIEAAAAFTGSLTLLDDTINANFASSGGGVSWAGTTGSTFAVQNTIIAKNFALTGPDANNPAGTFTDNGGNLIGISGTNSGNTGFTATTTQTGTVASPLNPLLGPLAANGASPIGLPGSPVVLPTEALSAGSPAIDKAVAASVAVDERGFPRPDGRGSDTGAQDVGAFESNPLSGNAAFVQTLYFNFLKRLGDVNNPNDAGVWVNLLNAGRITPQAVANAIARSTEGLGILVNGLYQKLLNRNADPAGKSTFVSLLQHGTTVEQVIVDIVTSQEYTNLNGMTDMAFIQSLYRQLLGREASPREVNAWLGVLASQGRAAVARDLLQSAEFRSDVVEQVYGFTYAPAESVASLFADLLHRPTAPPGTEISAWVSSGFDILTIQIDITGSAEFVARASTGLLF
jgi:hypothetical protein